MEVSAGRKVHRIDPVVVVRRTEKLRTVQAAVLAVLHTGQAEVLEALHIGQVVVLRIARQEALHIVQEEVRRAAQSLVVRKVLGPDAVGWEEERRILVAEEDRENV